MERGRGGEEWGEDSAGEGCAGEVNGKRRGVSRLHKPRNYSEIDRKTMNRQRMRDEGDTGVWSEDRESKNTNKKRKIKEEKKDTSKLWRGGFA